MPVALLGHPSGAGEMAVECLPGTGRFTLRIDVQNDPRDFVPRGAFRVRVEQTQIGDDVLFVITRQHRVGGGRVGDIGIKGGFLI